MSTVTSLQYNYLNGTYFPAPVHLQQQPWQPYIGSAPSPIAPPVVPPVYSAPAAVPDVYSLPQYLQTQQLFQRVAQAITPETIENVKAALASSEIEQEAEVKKESCASEGSRTDLGRSYSCRVARDAKPVNYHAVGRCMTKVNSSGDMKELDDFRLFCGNRGNEVNDDVLSKTFSRFPNFNMARFFQPSDLVVALKEMNGKYVGNRPVQLRKSKWKYRIDYEALARQKNLSPKKAKSPKKSPIKSSMLSAFTHQLLISQLRDLQVGNFWAIADREA
ncbi:hypothetical protein KY284_024566 [Solanum tuberosum]|nr:hypothetical protein KY284_024566 [Solanum tuberosum]